jgi:hypothetical protein
MHVDDGAEAADEGAAAARVEAGQLPEGALHVLPRHVGRGHALDAGQVRKVIVDGLQLPVVGVLEEAVEAVLDLACEDRDAQVHGVLHLRRDREEHRQDAADMEAAHGDLDVAGTKLAGDVHGARELVGLHTHQGDHAVTAVALDHVREPVDSHPGVGLVDGGDAKPHVLAEDAALRGVAC